MNSLQTGSWLPYSQHQTTVESLTMREHSCVWMQVCSAHFRFSSPGEGKQGFWNSFQVIKERLEVQEKKDISHLDSSLRDKIYFKQKQALLSSIEKAKFR